MKLALSELTACFQGVIPSILSTCSRDGEPNITYISQVYYVDEAHVALSCQFFNKTRRNLTENGVASVIVHDPITFETRRLLLRFHHSEFEGELFDTMALRIQVIASHTGMSGVFRLISADVFDVLECEPVADFLAPPDPVLDAQPRASSEGPMTELRGLQVVSDRIAAASDLDALMAGTLAALDETFHFQHSMLLFPDESGTRLYAVASRGYGAGGIGAEVAMGQGIIGTVAERRRMIRLSGVSADLRYGRAIRARVAASGDGAALAPEIPLPGLCDAQAQLALPLLAGERLVGVLALESRDPLCFDEWDEAYLGILTNQIALAIDRMQAADDDATPAAQAAPRSVSAPVDGRRRRFVFYRNDDCVFVDGEYLVRNVPGKILWKVLQRRVRDNQLEFSNRELRLDPWLGLPSLKDNLEARLILLRKRLAEKVPDVRLVPVKRGRFAVELDCEVELAEKDSA